MSYDDGVMAERKRCLQILKTAKPNLHEMSGIEIQMLNGSGWMDLFKESVRQLIESGEENAMISSAHARKELNAIDILLDLADGCTRAEDVSFWILTSAAAYLGGHDMQDGLGSSAALFYWQAKL